MRPFAMVDVEQLSTPPTRRTTMTMRVSELNDSHMVPLSHVRKDLANRHGPEEQRAKDCATSHHVSVVGRAKGSMSLLAFDIGSMSIALAFDDGSEYRFKGKLVSWLGGAFTAEGHYRGDKPKIGDDWRFHVRAVCASTGEFRVEFFGDGYRGTFFGVAQDLTSKFVNLGRGTWSGDS